MHSRRSIYTRDKPVSYWAVRRVIANWYSAIHRVLVTPPNPTATPIPTDFTHRDPQSHINLAENEGKDGKVDVHRHPELKRKVYSALAQGDEGELSISLPPGCIVRGLGDNVQRKYSYAFTYNILTLQLKFHRPQLIKTRRIQKSRKNRKSRKRLHRIHRILPQLLYSWSSPLRSHLKVSRL